jgi:hypothetical protein
LHNLVEAFARQSPDGARLAYLWKGRDADVVAVAVVDLTARDATQPTP